MRLGQVYYGFGLRNGTLSCAFALSVPRDMGILWSVPSCRESVDEVLEEAELLSPAPQLQCYGRQNIDKVKTFTAIYLDITSTGDARP